MSESNDRKVSKETKNKIFWETTVESEDKTGSPRLAISGYTFINGGFRNLSRRRSMSG